MVIHMGGGGGGGGGGLLFHYALWQVFCKTLKEELHNRFNSISEKRVNNFKHNSENLMKIGWK